ncbi:fasciclin domain-containing protein [Nocardioides sp. P5_C9_2]
MLKRHLAGPVAGALVAAALATAPIAPANAQRAAGTDSLGALLAADGQKLDKNWKDFDIIEAAVLAVADAKPSTPLLALVDGKKRLTAFAPTDAAFRALVTDLTGTAPKNEKDTVAAIVATYDIDTIESVLLYHVVAGATLTSTKVVAAAKKKQKITMANGATIRVKLMKGKVVLVDKDKNDRDARAIPMLLDLNKGNRQVAHGIDRVLRPLDL